MTNARPRPVVPRRIACASLACLTVGMGLLWRLAPMHLPPFLFKYGGSALWAAMVYWLIAGGFPRMRPVQVAIAAGIVAALVEFSRLHHTPAEDAFRLTLAGRLLLGRIFSVWDILAYWIAIAITCLGDVAMSRRLWS